MTPDMDVLARRRDISREATALRLAAARIATGRSKAQFGRDTGASIQTIINVEKANQYPPRQVLFELHQKHGIDLNFVLNGDWEHLPFATVQKLQTALAGLVAEAPRTRG